MFGKENNAWIGVGTGDVRDEIEKQYQIDNSILSDEYRLRAHNQFLTFLVSFGIIGLIVFVLSIIYPLFKITDSYLYLSFVVIALLSMLTEDTLESQAGVTFFAFLNIFLLLLENRSLNSLQK
jgi:O-antigen ligase